MLRFSINYSVFFLFLAVMGCEKSSQQSVSEFFYTEGIVHGADVASYDFKRNLVAGLIRLDQKILLFFAQQR